MKDLEEKEKKSRKNIFEVAGKALETDYRSRVADKIAEIVSAAAGPSLKLAKSNLLGDPLAIPDFAYRNPKGIFVVGVLICGPYRDKDLYRRRAFEWLSKAYILLNIFELMFLVLPDNAEVVHFKSLMRSLKISGDALRIVKIYSSQK